ncbi:General transcriptional corepressor-like protein [Emericellopsis cladophorae]|uniref:General transcriptional corepressor-like protein n=1 Tax=Emericellopsis cladophorae TaxID=2686198 RepID=A0A9P9Y299_9HYPO|nr:General transcriptional corepressor-like protein [Emericellopsis cladophorae]KAI6781838.1 General transcriptional corepressor-like protein [Emericellopsis cladophorae]
MAANHHPSPTMMMGQQHQQQQQQQHHHQHHPPPGHTSHPPHWAGPTLTQSIAGVNEHVWLQIGSFSELLRVPDEALHAYERAMQANPNSTAAMNAIGMLYKGKEAYEKALEFFRTIVQMEPQNGEAWGNLGHCYLMSENLQKAYDAYQQALVNMRDPKDPMLWYGIGILYDRYGSYDYAEEAFSQVMQIQPDFDKANEIYFRLGIIYKGQNKFHQSLECFNYIVNSPPAPLTRDDIWFQIGHVHEQQKQYDNAKAAYNQVLDNTPNHAKVLQQLGWLHHQQSSSFESQERAIAYLERSVQADGQDSQSWYLLGRCYMSQQKYPKAYEAYQQAVYRDGKNPTFWCSIGVLYYQINQYRDALDAYSRAIRLNPFISEVWYDLGTLYESCNNQVTDAMDAYQRAAELDPDNPHIKARLQLLRSGTNGGPPPAAPQPADVHPNTYQASGPQGPSWGGPQQHPPSGGPPPPASQGGAAAGENWAGRLAGVNPPSQPANPFNERSEGYRGQALPGPQRQPTPQQEAHMRQGYPEPGRGAPPPRRGQSPPPSAHHYGQPPPSSHGQTPGHPPGSEGRIPNPNWGGAAPSPAGPPPSHLNGATHSNGGTPFRANNSPRPDGRPPLGPPHGPPPHDNRMPSPTSAYPQHQPPMYPAHHHEGAHPGAPESNAAQAPSSVPGGEQRPADERPTSTGPGPKRMREWEEESAVKKPASEENRARLEDVRHRRPSTPRRESFRRNSEARRAEDQKRNEDQRRAEEPPQAKEAYHPSEAAHHQGHHASGAQGHPGQAPSPVASAAHEKPRAEAAPKEEPAAAESTPVAQPTQAAQPANEPERAARKMDVDEDYDDSGEDEKKAAHTNGTVATAPAAAVDSKTSPKSTSGVANGGSTASAAE